MKRPGESLVQPDLPRRQGTEGQSGRGLAGYKPLAQLACKGSRAALGWCSHAFGLNSCLDANILCEHIPENGREPLLAERLKNR